MIRIVLFILISVQAIGACSSTKNNKENYKNDSVISNSSIYNDSIRCDILVIKYTEAHLDKLLYTDLYKFLYTFSKDCSKNVEYSEYSNEMLFKVLEKYPEQLISCMSKEKSLNLDYILSELSTPILDINGKVIYERVQNALGDKLIKEKVLEALKKAIAY
jgi:hypothetical protein